MMDDASRQPGPCNHRGCLKLVASARVTKATARGGKKRFAMASTRAYDKPLSVEVFDGEVVIRAENGPMGVSLTPSAAAQTAQQLAEAATVAERHRSAKSEDPVGDKGRG